MFHIKQVSTVCSTVASWTHKFGTLLLTMRSNSTIRFLLQKIVLFLSSFQSWPLSIDPLNYLYYACYAINSHKVIAVALLSSSLFFCTLLHSSASYLHFTRIPNFFFFQEWRLCSPCGFNVVIQTQWLYHKPVLPKVEVRTSFGFTNQQVWVHRSFESSN